MRSFTEQIIELAIFVLLLTVLLAAPWFFGAWEMWYFWPFATIIFGTTALLAIRLILSAIRRTTGTYPGRIIALVLPLPFLVYAICRGMFSTVFMDAERSVLLFITPWLLCLCILWGLRHRNIGIMYFMMGMNFAALGLYGIANHFITQNAKVLWLDGYPQYQTGYLRATGSFFCPDHFAGAMELGLCLALGVILNRENRHNRRIPAAVLLIICITGILLSKSRGAGITVIVVGLAALIYGLRQWPAKLRWSIRISTAIIAITLMAVFWKSNTTYIRRFRDYINVPAEITGRQRLETMQHALLQTSRGRMISAALRVWRTRPWLGIGPGMHQNLWFGFAATPDGDREKGIRPSQTNTYFHSFEVHSDWVQLLQEYGLTGLLLFMIPLCGLWIKLTRTLNTEAAACRERLTGKLSHRGYSMLLSAMLAIIAMAFHSLGDFNLQIPAINWLLAAIIACALAQIQVSNNKKNSSLNTGSHY